MNMIFIFHTNSMAISFIFCVYVSSQSIKSVNYYTTYLYEATSIFKQKSYFVNQICFPRGETPINCKRFVLKRKKSRMLWCQDKQLGKCCKKSTSYFGDVGRATSK